MVLVNRSRRSLFSRFIVAALVAVAVYTTLRLVLAPEMPHPVRLLLDVVVGDGAPKPFDVEETRRAVSVEHSSPTSSSSLLAPYAPWVHGVWAFVPHRLMQEGALTMAIDMWRVWQGELRSNQPAGIVVDALALDAGWWKEDDAFGLDPDRFPAGPSMLASMLRDRGVSAIALWASALLPDGDRDAAMAATKGWLMENGAGRPLHYRWRHRRGAPSVEGNLLDVTHPEVAEWLKQRLRPIIVSLMSTPDGDAPLTVSLRLGGVDALLDNERRIVRSGNRGYLSREEYRDEYYRLFLRVIRDVAGPDAVVLGRAVDTHEGQVYRTFAPPDALFAGIVGDHGPSFASLRESMMDVLHAGTRGYVSVGTVIGGTLGLEDPDEDVIRVERLHQEMDAVGSDVDGPMGKYWAAVHDISMVRNETCGSGRRLELVQRWAQVAAWQPMMGFGDIGRLAGSSLGSDRHRQRGLIKHLATLVKLHRALRLYVAHEAALSFWRSVEHRLKRDIGSGPLDSEETDVAGWGLFDPGHEGGIDDQSSDSIRRLLHPLAPSRIGFDDPVGTWEYLLGSSILVAPIVHSFGLSTTEDVDFPPSRLLRTKQMTRRYGGTELPDTSAAVERSQGRRWVRWGREEGGPLSLSEEEAATGVPFKVKPDEALVFVAAGAIIPLTSGLPLRRPSAAVSPLWASASQQDFLLYSVSHPSSQDAAEWVVQRPFSLLGVGSLPSQCNELGYRHEGHGMGTSVFCIERNTDGTTRSSSGTPVTLGFSFVVPLAEAPRRCTCQLGDASFTSDCRLHRDASESNSPDGVSHTNHLLLGRHLDTWSTHSLDPLEEEVRCDVVEVLQPASSVVWAVRWRGLSSEAPVEDRLARCRCQ